MKQTYANSRLNITLKIKLFYSAALILNLLNFLKVNNSFLFVKKNFIKYMVKRKLTQISIKLKTHISIFIYFLINFFTSS